MDIESLRAYCLSLPHVTEDLKPQWGDALLFRIANKIFVSVGLGDVPVHMHVKCTPDRFHELLEIEGVQIAAYVGRYHWIDFPVAGVFRDAEIKQLIRDSYENVKATLPKSTREKLRMKK